MPHTSTPAVRVPTRPCCAYCGKPARKRTTTIFVGSPDAKIKHADNIYPEQKLRSKADCQRHTNQQVVSVHYDSDRSVWRFSTWDGVGWALNYGLFCTMDCGEKFGRAAYHAGYRIRAREVA